MKQAVHLRCAHLAISTPWVWLTNDVFFFASIADSFKENFRTIDGVS